MLIARIAFIILLTAAATVFSKTNARQANGRQTPQPVPAKAAPVQVRAVVTDRNGQFIEGLTAEDFLLTEDDVQQGLESFSMEKTVGRSSSATLSQAGVSDAVPAGIQGVSGSNSPRVIALLVDTAHISSNGLEGVRIALRRFVHEQTAGNDLIAIMTSGGKPGTKGEFTADREKLASEMKKIRPAFTEFESFLTPVLCGRVVRRDPQAVGLTTLIINAEDRSSGSVQMPSNTNAEAEAVSKCTMLLLETASRRRSLMSSIGAAVDKMSAMPGQHIIALFTEGFSMTAPGGDVAISEIRPAISSAVRSGVMIYAFDARVPLASKQVNMESYSLAGEILNSARDLQHGMSLMASQTGGDAFYNLDSLSEQLQLMLGGNRVCYRLAYYSPPAKDPRKYRSINVSVKGHPEYQVRAQKGYDMTGTSRSK